MASKISRLIGDIKSNPNFAKVGSVAQDLVDGNILMRKSFRRQYILVFMIAALFILYIGNHYTCDKYMRSQRELVKGNEDLRFELLSISAQLTEKGRESVVEDSVRAQLPELEVSKVPSITIEEVEK